MDISSRKGTDRCEDELKGEDEDVKRVEEKLPYLGIGMGNWYPPLYYFSHL
jgi:hypothetical protein